MKKSASDKHKERKRPRSDEEKKESLGAAKPPVAKGNVEDESFPRGGSTGLSHLEKRAVEMEARAEYEAELAGGKQPSSKRPSLDGKPSKRAKHAATSNEDGSSSIFDSEGSKAGASSKFVELLKAKSLSMGMKIWGLVLEVASRGITISLPHGLRGHVAPEEASDVIAQSLDPKRGSKKPSSAIPPTSIDLTKLFLVGQYVRCIVIGLPDPNPGPSGGLALASKKTVKLSLRLKRVVSGLTPSSLLKEGSVVPACIKSCEDHGYALDFGFKSVGGFLKKKDHEAAYGQGADLEAGMMIDVVVTKGLPPNLQVQKNPSASSSAVVQVAIDPNLVASSTLKDSDDTSLDALLPGSLVTARVKSLLSDGLLVTFFGIFHGTVDPFHLSCPTSSTIDGQEDKKGGGGDWRRSFSEGQKVRARILYIDPATKQAGLSLLPHLLSLTLPSPTPMLGQLFGAAKVKRIFPGLGMLVELPMTSSDDDADDTDDDEDEEEEEAEEPLKSKTKLGKKASKALKVKVSCSGFVHVSNIVDRSKEEVSKPPPALEKMYKVGQTLQARVIGFRLVDGLATLSLKKSVIDQVPGVSYAELQPGNALTATVTRIEDYGLLISAGPNVRGIIPKLHASDLGADKGLSKFKIGQKVTGRVLQVDSGARKLTLTLKPGLLGSRLNPLTSLAQASPGLRAHGVIAGVKDFGLFVTFYGGLSGLLRSSQLGIEEGGKTSEAGYSVGQVIKVAVLAVEPGTGRLKLALASTKKLLTQLDADEEGGGADGNLGGGFKPGDLAHAVVMKVVTAQPQGSKEGSAPGHPRTYFLVSLSSSHQDKDEDVGGRKRGVLGRLEAFHLSDHQGGVEALSSVIKVGSDLGQVLILDGLSQPSLAPSTPSKGQQRAAFSVTRKQSMILAAPSSSSSSLPSSTTGLKHAVKAKSSQPSAVLPISHDELVEGTLLPGFVASVTSDAVFVRFLAGVTGRAGLAQISDHSNAFISDPRRRFVEGQSVVAYVSQVKKVEVEVKDGGGEDGGTAGSTRSQKCLVSLSLKPSLTLSPSAPARHLECLFGDLELADELSHPYQDPSKPAASSALTSPSSSAVDWSQLAIGSKVEGLVHEAVAYGLLIDLPSHPDLVGLVLPHQQAPSVSLSPLPLKKSKSQTSQDTKGAKRRKKAAAEESDDDDEDDNEGLVSLLPGQVLTPGAPITARILDLVKKEGQVSLSTLPAQLLSSQPSQPSVKSKGKVMKGKAASFEISLPPIGSQVEAVVELAREAPMSYLVLSLPGFEGTPIAFASTASLNLVDASGAGLGAWKPVPGDRVTAVRGASVYSHPDAGNGGRLLLNIPLLDQTASSAGAGVGSSQGKGSNQGGVGGGVGEGGGGGQRAVPGTLVGGVVTAIHDSHVDVLVGKKLTCRLHISELRDLDDTTAATDAKQHLKSLLSFSVGHSNDLNPLAAYAVHQHIDGLAVIGRLNEGGGGGVAVDLSLRPSRVKICRSLPSPGSTSGKDGQEAAPAFKFPLIADLSIGTHVTGVVQQVTESHLWVSLSPSLRAKVSSLDALASLLPSLLSSYEPEQQSGEVGSKREILEKISDLRKSGFWVGQAVAGWIQSISVKSRQIDLSLDPITLSSPTLDPPASAVKTRSKGSKDEKGSAASSASSLSLSGGLVINGHQMVLGRVVNVTGTGVLVQLPSSDNQSDHSQTKSSPLGLISPTDLHDVWVDKSIAGVKKGAIVLAKVLPSVDSGKKDNLATGDPSVKGKVTIKLSARPSHGGWISKLKQGAALIDGAGAGAAKAAKKRPAASLAASGAVSIAPEVVDLKSLAPGASLTGYVKASGPKGVFVSLDRLHDARIKIKNLSDTFIESPSASFPPGLKVQGRVLSITPEGMIDMTLRAVADPSRAGGGLGTATATISITDLVIGQVVTGKVRRATDFGVFVDIAGLPKPSGLAHVSELVDGNGKIRSVEALFAVGQAVKAKVLRIDLDKEKISLGMKPSYFDEDEEGEGEGGEGGGRPGKKQKESDRDIDAEAVDMEEEEKEGDGEGEEEGEDDDDDEDESMDDVDDIDAFEEDDKDEDEAEEEEEPELAALTTPKPYSVWGQEPAAAANGDAAGHGDGHGHGDADDDEALKEPKVKVSKGAKKKEKEEQERAIREQEMARMHGKVDPKTPADYERLAAASPSSSFVWIKWMAFLIQMGDIEQARAVAQKSLDTIGYREEGEKFNVWLAWLNLENSYGQPNPEEALTKLFQKALPYVNQKKLHLAVLGIAERSERKQLTETLLKAMTRKFGGSAKIWLRLVESQLSSGEGEKVKGSLDRAIKSLHPRKHIKVTTGAALLEFRVGSAERGRGILEGLLRNYPKRLDLWSVYIDQEVKAGDERRIRALFERATSLQLPAKKMKFLFKRYLEYEREHGDENTVAHVKQRAMDFVEKNSS